MKRYLLNVTFYAGSDDPEDTDRDMFLLSVDKEYSEKEMKKTFKNANKMLRWSDYDDDDDESEEFPISYEEEGININTLMEGVRILTKGKVEEVYSNCGKIENIDNCYVIEQWQ